MGFRMRSVESVGRLMSDLSFYRGKKVLVTGHTGFKGSWLCRILVDVGAFVTGYSLDLPTAPCLFRMSGLDKEMESIYGDIRDFSHLLEVFRQVQPEIVLHLAAQPIVREGYRDPRSTYEVNVMGTVNVMECVRRSPCVRSVLNVTTDKVYRNNEWYWGYREGETLDGFDPYSNSKSCSELVTRCYKDSYFKGEIAVSTARAGNVIGGGDFAQDRIIPDCVRAAFTEKTIAVRNLYSVRPYQHVLEPLAAYLLIAEAQYTDPALAGCYNVGPDDYDCIQTGKLVELFCKYWGDGISWESKPEAASPHEANFLKLDSSRLRSVLGWKPKWHIEEAVKETCIFNKVWLSDGDVCEEMRREIREFFNK